MTTSSPSSRESILNVAYSTRSYLLLSLSLGKLFLVDKHNPILVGQDVLSS